MKTSMQRVLLVATIASLATTASAQFDNQWLTVSLDNSRLKDGTGAPATYITGDTQEKDMAWGDLNQDGWTDLVIVRKQPVTTTGAFPNYLLMNEGGQLVDRSALYASDTDVPGDSGFMTPTNDRDVVIVDVNNDGWLDVVTATTLSDGQPKHISHPRVYMNKGNGVGGWQGLRFETNRIPLMSPTPRFCAVAAGDVTGDGFVDLYFADYGDLSDKLLINDGTGFFSDSGTTRLTATMLDAAFGSAAKIIDMNGDGAKDIVRSSGVTGNGAGPMVSVAYNNPLSLGNFPQSLFQSQIGTNTPYHVDVGDLNQDGRPDIITSDDGADGYRYNTANDGLGRVVWGALKTYTYVTGGDDGFAGTNLISDLNNDGWPDTIHADVDVDIGGCSRRCHIFHNPGGTPGSQITLKEEAGSVSGAWRGVVGMLASDLTGTFDVAAFDIDNDGDKDLVFGRCSGTFVWMNQLLQPATAVTYCYGDGTGTACPCANNSAVGAKDGCISSLGQGGRLRTVGNASVALDTFVLQGSQVPNGPGLYFQGTTQLGGGAGAVFGDGLRCVGGSIIRLGIVVGSGNASTYPSGATPPNNVPISIKGFATPSAVLNYQLWYRDSATFCSSAVFNLSNAINVTWTL